MFYSSSWIENQYVIEVWEANVAICFDFLFNIYIKEKIVSLKYASTL